MFDNLLDWDRKIFVYLNNLGVEEMDTFWTVATIIISWTPLFILFTVLMLLCYEGKGGLYRCFAVLALLFTVLVLTDLTKEVFERLRPNNEEEISASIRILRYPISYSFFSGHAATSFSTTTLIYLFLRKTIRWTWIFYLWPLIFSYSRIYVGVHYPLDILTGAVIGIVLALLSYRLFNRFIAPYSDSSRP